MVIFVIKGFRTIVIIFIVISTTFRPICPPAFFRRLLNSGTFMELWTMSFIESTGVACSDSISHNRVQVLSILSHRVRPTAISTPIQLLCEFHLIKPEFKLIHLPLSFVQSSFHQTNYKHQISICKINTFMYRFHNTL